MCVPSVDLTARSEGDRKQGRPTLDFGLNHDDEDKGEGDEGGVNVALAPALGSILVARGGFAGTPAAKRTRHSRLCRRRPAATVALARAAVVDPTGDDPATTRMEARLRQRRSRRPPAPQAEAETEDWWTFLGTTTTITWTSTSNSVSHSCRS